MVRGAARCRWGIEPLAPARDAARCDFGSRRRVHAAGFVAGYRLTCLGHQLRLPVGFLDACIKLAVLLRELVGSPAKFSDIDGADDAKLGLAVTGLAGARGLCDLVVGTLKQPEVVAASKGVRECSTVSKRRAEVGFVDSGDECLQLVRVR